MQSVDPIQNERKPVKTERKINCGLEFIYFDTYPFKYVPKFLRFRRSTMNLALVAVLLLLGTAGQ